MLFLITLAHFAHRPRLRTAVVYKGVSTAHFDITSSITKNIN